MSRKFLIVFSTLSAFVICSFFVACSPKADNVVDGLAPIYLTEQKVYEVSVQEGKSITNAGKIFQEGTNLTLQVDVNLGVHIINCTDPKNPVRVKFINVPGATEATVKDNILLVNNVDDLVSIDISDLNNIKLLNRVKGVFVNAISTVPIEANTFFECVDSNKGIVVGWQNKKLVNPKCKTLP